MIVRDLPEPPTFDEPVAGRVGGLIDPPRPWSLADHPVWNVPVSNDWGTLVTCFFNPAGYRRPVHNLGAFLDWCLGARWSVYVAELTFHNQVPVLPVSNGRVSHFRLGEEGVMFQKEALLSAVVERLPRWIQKVILVDCDVVPESGLQYEEALEQLDRVSMVQPFSEAIWCQPNGSDWARKKSTAWAVTTAEPQPEALNPEAFHPGFAVALRRDFFEKVGPLYGCPITGSGDVALWQSALAPLAAPGSDGRPIYTAPAPRAYRERVAAWVGGKVGCVKGGMRHFWHGNPQRRAYISRYRLLHEFAPEVHLRIDGRTGLPVWSPKGLSYQEAMRAYFASRQEDE